MSDRKLLNGLRRRHEDFYGELYEAPVRNRHEALIAEGAAADLVALLRSSEPEVRVDALLGLGLVFERDGAGAQALEAVKQHSMYIEEQGFGAERHAALYALGRSRDRALLDGFRQLLGSEAEGHVMTACFLLGYAGDRSAVGALQWIATSDDYRPDTRGAAIWALGRIGGAEALSTLRLLVERGVLLEYAVGALGDAGTPEDLERLTGPLLAGPDFVRLAAVTSIVALLDGAAKPAARQRLGLVPSLRAASLDGYAPVAVQALHALVSLGVGVDEAIVRRAFDLPREDFSRQEAYFLSRAG